MLDRSPVELPRFVFSLAIHETRLELELDRTSGGSALKEELAMA